MDERTLAEKVADMCKPEPYRVLVRAKDGRELVTSSWAFGKLSAACRLVQGETEFRATKNKTNPHFKSEYADHDSINESLLPLTSKHGISVLQPACRDGGEVIVCTLLTHDSGEWLKSELSLPLERQSPQAVASAMTYGKRIGSAAAINLAAGDDDDGNAAEGNLAQGSRSASAPPRGRAAAPAPQSEKKEKDPPVPPPEGIDAAIKAASSSKELLVCIDAAKAIRPVEESERLLELAQEKLRERIVNSEQHQWLRYSSILAKVPEKMRNSLLPSYRDRGREKGWFGRGADGPR